MGRIFQSVIQTYGLKGGENMSVQEMEAQMDEIAGEGNWELFYIGMYTRTYYNKANGEKTTFFLHKERLRAYQRPYNLKQKDKPKD